MKIQTKGYIYLLEFKLDGSASQALQQIEEKHYARPFAADARRLFKIGVSFSTKQRCVTEWKVA